MADKTHKKEWQIFIHFLQEEWDTLGMISVLKSQALRFKYGWWTTNCASAFLATAEWLWLDFSRQKFYKQKW